MLLIMPILQQLKHYTNVATLQFISDDDIEESGILMSYILGKSL